MDFEKFNIKCLEKLFNELDYNNNSEVCYACFAAQKHINSVINNLIIELKQSPNYMDDILKLLISINGISISLNKILEEITNEQIHRLDQELGISYSNYSLPKKIREEIFQLITSLKEII